MIALAASTWLIVAGIGVGALGILAWTALVLYRRIKGLLRSVSGASAEINEALEEMRGDLERANEGLAGLRKEPVE